jgi:hypothetical protein
MELLRATPGWLRAYSPKPTLVISLAVKTTRAGKNCFAAVPVHVGKGMTTLLNLRALLFSLYG